MSQQKISTVTGKKGEMRFVSALIERGFTPFIPIVDLGIDVIAEKSTGNQPRYFGFQIKTSTLSSKNYFWNWYIDNYSFKCAQNFFYVLSFEDDEKFPSNVKKDPHFNACIIPSKFIQKPRGHWSPYDKQGGESFDVAITVNMLEHIGKYSKEKTNSGIALRYLNKCPQLRW